MQRRIDTDAVDQSGGQADTLILGQGAQTGRSGDGLFNLRDGSTAAPDSSVRVASGQLESSNVNPAEALAEMIEMSRHYEMQVRAMNTADELDSASSRLIRMNG